MQMESQNADPPKRKRRWFQFSLRTLLIAVTMFCVVVGGYVGRQVKIVRERKTMAQWIEAHGGFCLIAVELPTHDGAERPSLLRCWLGDHTVEEVFLPNAIDADEAAQIRATFPGVHLRCTFGGPFRPPPGPISLAQAAGERRPPGDTIGGRGRRNARRVKLCIVVRTLFVVVTLSISQIPGCEAIISRLNQDWHRGRTAVQQDRVGFVMRVFSRICG